jgi:hypothetical protein
MLAAQSADPGHPAGVSLGEPFRLVVPFETDPRKWGRMRWTNVISTEWPGGGEGVTGVASLGTVAAAYSIHPEPKRSGPDGASCGKRTEGLLQRRPVVGAGTVRIGKEAHRLDDRGSMTNLVERLDTFADPCRDPWAVVLPRLRALSQERWGIELMPQASGLKPMALRDVLAARSRPHKSTRLILAEVAPTQRTRTSILGRS